MVSQTIGRGSIPRRGTVDIYLERYVVKTKAELKKEIEDSLEETRNTFRTLDKTLNSRTTKVVNFLMPVLSFFFLLLSGYLLVQGSAFAALVAAIVFFGIYGIRLFAATFASLLVKAVEKNLKL